MASRCLPAGLGIDFIRSSSAFENLKQSISIFSALPGLLIISGLSDSWFVLSLLVSVLLAAFENLKLINFDLELCIRKFEANRFQFFQLCRDNEICSGCRTMSVSWFPAVGYL